MPICKPVSHSYIYTNNATLNSSILRAFLRTEQISHSDAHYNPVSHSYIYTNNATLDSSVLRTYSVSLDLSISSTYSDANYNTIGHPFIRTFPETYSISRQ